MPNAPLKIAFSVAVCVTLVATAALASPPQGSPRGVWTPWQSATEQAGVESLYNHAAGLAFMSPVEFAINSASRLGQASDPSSVAALLGGRLGPVSLAMGFAGFYGGADAAASTLRLDIGFALRLGEHVGVGFQWHKLFNPGQPDIDSYASWSVASTVRFTRGLSWALAFDRLNRPELGGGRNFPIARNSFGIRPFGERLTAAFDIDRELRGAGITRLGGSLRFLLVRGLVVGGYGHYSFYPGGDARPSFTSFGATLGFLQGGLSAEAGFHGVSPEGGGAFGGQLSALVKMRSERHPSLVNRDGFVVKMTLNGPIPERPVKKLFGRSSAGFAQWLIALDTLAHDPAVSGVVLDIRGAPRWGQCWELRQAMGRLKDAGKRVHAVLTMADMRAVYLASAADKVHLYESGGLMISGLSVTRTYYFGLMNTLGIKAELIKYADYKSAPEPFMRSGPSEPSKQQTDDLIKGFYTAWSKAIAEGRKLDVTTIKALLDRGPFTMHTAQTELLVDDLVNDDSLVVAVKQDVGAEARLTERYRPAPQAWKRWGGKRAIAIVPVVGSIVDGVSSNGGFNPLAGGMKSGDKSIVAALKAAAADRSVVGIVVRVDSGGGSALASDRMYQAVQRAAKAKPLIVSFGNIAASGGYYLAAGAPEILMPPTGITGSIGIFAGKIDISGLYARLGLTTHTQKTNSRADMQGFHRPWTEAERTAALGALKAYYDRFVTLVSSGRKIPMDAAYDLARGHVYLGGQALKLKLIDRYGGLWDAMQTIRSKAGISTSEALGVRYFGSLSPLASLQSMVASVFVADQEQLDSGEAAEHTAARLLGLVNVAQTLAMMPPGAPMAMLPYHLDVR